MSSRKVVPLNPRAPIPDGDALAGKLDKLSMKLADQLIDDHDDPSVEQRISGLKALTTFWQARNKETPQEKRSAFDAYRDGMNAEED
jgi:hypothetical protein